jgi:hypothetical protein
MQILLWLYKITFFYFSIFADRPPQAYANLLKGNLDGLKKRDKKTAKAAAAKAKKPKATA